MKTFFTGAFIALIVSTVGFSGVAATLDKGVDHLKQGIEFTAKKVNK